MKMTKFDKVALKRMTVLVGLAGCEMIATDAGGNRLWAVGFPAGLHDPSRFTPFLRQSDAVSFEGSCDLLENRGRVVFSTFGDLKRVSGANPDFRPRRDSEEMSMIRKLTTRLAHIEKTRVPVTPKPKESEVIERELQEVSEGTTEPEKPDEPEIPGQSQDKKAQE